MRHKITVVLSIVFLLFLFDSCSTKKNTFVTRSFHNIHARFNGYYYGKVSLKEGVDKIEAAKKDDYSRILPVFIYASKEDKSVYPDMDRVIKKASTVIQRHTIVDKDGKEVVGAVKWIDDCYMLIGKAHLYKNDYFSAIESFEFVAKQYKKFPIKYEANLWLIRTFNVLGSFARAEELIDYLNNDKDFPKEHQAYFSALQADYYIQREMYTEAIKPLQKTIALTKKKKYRLRYTYILAQILQLLKDNKSASNFYEIVVKQHPPSYEMDFNANINLARTSPVDGDKAKQVKKDLIAMSKEEKNSEFLDQIYFALAELTEKEGDLPSTISYLNMSVRNSTTNTKQKAASYLKLADINFQQTDYKIAGAYYDSTVAVIDKDYPDYDQIINKKNNLSSLVKNLSAITQEDSLQKIASLSDKDKEALVAKLIAKVEEDEKRAEEERLKALNNPNAGSNGLFPNTQQQNNNQNIPGGAWYFYNPSTVSFGINEFARKWGSRKLEDNWRRSSKETINESEVAQEQQDTVGVKKGVNPKKTKEYYLKNLPLTADAVQKSNEKIIEAYYNLGSIYREQLSNNEKSVEAFETLIKRYPDNKHKLSCYYQLYRIYLSMNNRSRSDYYKNILLNEYPDTEYARIIKNPEFNKQALAKQNEVEIYYEETFRSYNDKKYDDVVSRFNFASTNFGQSPLMSKFAFLNAIAIGNLQGPKAFENALTQIIIKYPNDNVKTRAQELLDYIKQQNGGAPEIKKDTVTTPTVAYVLNPESEHFLVFIVMNDKGDLAKFKTNLSNINNTSFGSDNLTISSLVFNSESQIVIIKKFANKNKVMNYYEFIKASKNATAALDMSTTSYYPISAENFTLLFKDKRLDDYKKFAEENYLKRP